MNLFEAMFYRSSIRKYKDDPFTKELLNKIENIVNNLDVINSDIDMKVHIVEEGNKIHNIISGVIGSYGKVLAPHYLVVTSENLKGHLENVGYALEKVVLELTAMNIGTCWIGGHIKKELIKDIIILPNNHEPVLLIALGYPENFYDFSKRDVYKIKRKGIVDMLTGELYGDLSDVFEGIRIAPSAANSQPWRFVIDKKTIHLYRIKRSNIITKKFLSRINKVDMGIALSHLVIGLKHFGYKADIIKKEHPKKDKHEYFISVEFNR